MAYVQKATGTAVASTSISATLSGVADRNLLTAQLSYYYPSGGGGQAAPVAPEGWIPASAPTSQTYGGTGECIGVAVYYRHAAPAGTHSPSWTLPSGGYGVLTIAEFSGYASPVTVGQIASNGGSSANTTDWTTGTTEATTKQIALVLAQADGDQADGSTDTGLSSPAATGYTSLNLLKDASGQEQAEHSYKEVTTTGAQSGAWTKTSTAATQAWQASVVALYGADSPPQKRAAGAADSDSDRRFIALLDPRGWFSPAAPLQVEKWFADEMTAGPAAQSLVAGLFSNTSSFYAPTVSRGAVALVAPLFTNSNAFYGPTVSAGSQALTQATRFDNAGAFYGPTVTRGAVTLAVPLVTNAASFYAATVTRGAVTLTPDRADNSSAFYAPTVTRGAVSLAATRLDNSATFFAPAVSRGAVSLTPALFSNSAAFYGPTVTRGAVGLAPARLDNAAAFYAPTVSPGAVSLVAARFDNTAAFYAPTVSGGGVSLAPPLLANANSFYAPTVAPGAVTLQPARADNAQAFYAASVVPGSVTLTASRLDNSPTFYGPAVSRGSVALAPARLDNAQTFYAPSVSRGAVQLQPARLDNAPSFPAATVTRGAVVLEASRVENEAQFFAPGVSQQFSLHPPLLSNEAEFFTATVTPGAVTLAPALLANESTFFGPAVEPDSYLITRAQARLLYQVWLLHGLEAGSPLTVSQTARMAGGLEQAVSESGGAVTIHTTAQPGAVGVDPGLAVEELASLHGIDVDLVVSATSRAAGSVEQGISQSGGVTTVTRL